MVHGGTLHRHDGEGGRVEYMIGRTHTPWWYMIGHTHTPWWYMMGRTHTPWWYMIGRTHMLWTRPGAASARRSATPCAPPSPCLCRTRRGHSQARQVHAGVPHPAPPTPHAYSVQPVIGTRTHAPCCCCHKYALTVLLLRLSHDRTHRAAAATATHRAAAATAAHTLIVLLRPLPHTRTHRAVAATVHTVLLRPLPHTVQLLLLPHTHTLTVLLLLRPHTRTHRAATATRMHACTVLLLPLPHEHCCCCYCHTHRGHGQAQEVLALLICQEVVVVEHTGRQPNLLHPAAAEAQLNPPP